MVDGMREERIIPITPIWRRYQRLRRSSQRERLEEAHQLLERPELLAVEFGESVSHFASYSNIGDAFYPPGRPEREPGPVIARTNDLVLRLQRGGLITPQDAGTRRIRHDLGSEVIAVRPEQLACRYVDRELLVQRTTSPAKWDDGSRNVGGLRLDVLLADALDNTPIIGELKLPGDMDPFFALIQALACAAHLATPNQYERMRRHLPDAGFPDPVTLPRLDVWILSVDAVERPRGRYMADLQAAAEAIAPPLLAQPEISRSIRRLAWLAMREDSLHGMTADVLWAWESASP
jgi:hypothetical protein